MDSGSFSIWALLPDFTALNRPNTAEGLTALAVSLILGIFIVFIWTVFREWRASRNKVKALLSIVKDADKESLPEHYRMFRKSASEISDEVGNLWNEFHESLVYNESRNQVHNTLDASHFFNTYTLAHGLTDNRLVAAVPGLLTALGVMGTFAGLQMGLGGLELASGEVQTLIDGIKGMIQGASIAFASSFWGVLASVIFNVVEKYFERGVREQIASLQKKLDFLFPRITAEYSLREIQEQTALSTEALQGMAKRIGDKMQEAMLESSQKMRDGLEESLQKLLGPALEKLSENAHSSSQQVIEQMTSAFVDRIGGHVDAQREAMSSASQQMQDAIDGMQQRFAALSDFQENQQQRIAGDFESLLGKVTSKWDEQAATLAEQDKERNATIEQLTNRLTTMINQLGEFEKSFDILVSSNRETATKNYSAAQVLSDTAQKLYELKDSIATATRTLGEQSTAAIEEARTLSENTQTTLHAAGAMIETARSLNKQIEDVLASAKEASDQAIGGMLSIEENLERAQARLKVHVEELREAIQEMMENYADSVKTQTVERLREWNDQTSSFTSAMVTAVQAIQDVVDEFDDKVQGHRR